MNKKIIITSVRKLKNRIKNWLLEVFYTALGLGAVVTAIVIVGTVLGWVSDVFFDLDLAQQKFAKESQISDTQFLKTYCNLERICSDYEEVRQTCAEAGDIAGCIHIKMQGVDYSSCYESSIIGLPNELRPNKLQCFPY